jgi:hypothetical protein
LIFEQFICGDETSSSAGFVQHALHPACGVGQSLGFHTRFGDWKATTQEEGSSGKIPDYALIGGDTKARAVGEAKTPWAHNLASAFNQLQTRGEDASFRRFLGMI